MLAGSAFPTVQFVNFLVFWFFLKFCLSLKYEVAEGLSQRGGSVRCSAHVLWGHASWFQILLRPSPVCRISGSPNLFCLSPSVLLCKMKRIASFRRIWVRIRGNIYTEYLQKCPVHNRCNRWKYCLGSRNVYFLSANHFPHCFQNKPFQIR